MGKSVSCGSAVQAADIPMPSSHTLYIPERDARVFVKKMDKERRNYYEYFTDEKWLDITSYDLCIDSSRFTESQAVQIIKAAYENLLS